MAVMAIMTMAVMESVLEEFSMTECMYIAIVNSNSYLIISAEQTDFFLNISFFNSLDIGEMFSIYYSRYTGKFGIDVLGTGDFLAIFLEQKQAKLPDSLKNSGSLDYLDQILLVQVSIFISIDLLISPFWQHFSSKCLIHIYDKLSSSQSFQFTKFIRIFHECSSLGKEKTVVFLLLCSLNNSSPHSTYKPLHVHTITTIIKLDI